MKERQSRLIGGTHRAGSARRTGFASAFASAILLFGACVGQAAIVTMTASDATNDTSTSFNAAGHWDNAAAPSAVNTYATSTYNVLTPNNNNDYTFGGYSLTVDTGGALVYNGYKNTNNITVARLILNGGKFLNSPSNTTSDLHLKGGIEVSATGGTINAGNQNTTNGARDITVDSKLTGTGTLVLQSSTASPAGGTITFTSSNSTFAGDIIISGNSKLNMASNSLLNFVIGDSEVNNAVTSNNNRYAAFNGIFNIDLTNAGSTVGDHWTLIDLTKLTSTFNDASFSIIGFTKTAVAPNANLWTSGNYQFNEATGILSVVAVPEPAALTLMSLGMALVIRRRKP